MCMARAETSETASQSKLGRHTIRVQHHILRLQVTVHDAVLVQVVQCQGHLCCIEPRGLRAVWDTLLRMQWVLWGSVHWGFREKILVDIVCGWKKSVCFLNSWDSRKKSHKMHKKAFCWGPTPSKGQAAPVQVWATSSGKRVRWVRVKSSPPERYSISMHNLSLVCGEQTMLALAEHRHFAIIRLKYRK